MKKWVAFLIVFSLLFFTSLNNLFVGDSYHYMITVSFTLIMLISYSIIAILSFRALRSLSDINYMYFSFISTVMAFMVFFIVLKNLTFSTFDKLYFTQIKFVQILFFSFSLFLIRAEKKVKVMNITLILTFIFNLYLAFILFRIEMMKYLPLILYLEILVMYDFFSEKIIKRLLIEILFYNIISELLYVYYLNFNSFFSYLSSLILFLMGIIKIGSHFSYMLNRDYYRKQYIKEKKLNRLLNISEKPIIILQEFTVKKLNKAALELFGYNTIGELKGKNVFNFLNILEFQEIDFDTGLQDEEKKVIITKSDGTTHRLIVNIFRVKGVKTREYILEFKEEVNFGDIFYKLNDELQNVVFIYDEDEGYKYVSEGIINVLHYEPKDFYEDKWFTRKISVDNKFEKIIKNREEQSSFMAKYKTKEGEIVYLKENIKRIDIGGKNLFYGSVTEVTEFINEIEELNAVKKDLEEKNSKKEMTMSIVSHEIRTPITAIIGFLENIIINNRTIDKTIDNMIKKAYSNSIRLKELVNNLLDLNKLNAGKMEIYKEVNDLKALVDEVLLNNETLIDIKSIKSLNKMKDKVEVISDSAMLYQIINNIVSNSIKYNKENGVLEISVTDEGKSVVLDIKDSGIGIPDENRERVFLEYERIRGTKAKGTGLGLPLAKRLIELNDGEIWFDSQPEKGTTFHLRFKKV